MRALLVFPRATAGLLRKHARKDDLVLAVDAGAEACLAAGVVPTRLVGDMDSVTPATLAACEKAGVAIERHPSAKRDTDAALALRHAGGCEEVLFLGPGGGRADHALANLHLLAEAATWTRAWAVDEDVRVWVATPTAPLVLAIPPGAVVSLLPWDAEVAGITAEGFEYPLVEGLMRAGDPYGVSNVAAAPRQRVLVRQGRLLVMQPTQGIS